ncbi:MAG: ABC transporter substrate-binding protein [Proteobacteria bacterium]|nr:ABC transporter substrate-binding protein [Pseudomonadota bacterium]MBU1058735.1 ABC transporter substrate-binding protein [Pseudomonadota bacterium]
MLQKITVFFFSFLLFCLSIPVSGLGAAKTNTLRLALLPIPDVLPVYVAQEKGYFSELGISVEALPVGSALERDQLMQAGRIDGMINDILSAANFNREQGRVKIVSIARSPLGESPLFRILGAPGSDLKTVKGLAGIPIGISKNTVIEYISTRLLAADGVAAEAISYASVPILPQRLQLLLSGQLKAAALPDPLGASAIKAGAVEIVNDTRLSKVSASVITFSNETLLHKQEVVRSFMAAWDKAAAEINRDPASFQNLMLQKIRVPKNIESDFRPPPIPRKAVPTKAQWDDVMAWMLNKNILSTPLAYEDSVTSDFLAR